MKWIWLPKSRTWINMSDLYKVVEYNTFVELYWTPESVADTFHEEDDVQAVLSYLRSQRQN